METSQTIQSPGSTHVGTLFESMPFTKKHLFAGFVLFFAFIIEGWELMMIIFLSPSIAAEFNLTPVQVGSLIGAIFLGMIPGSYLAGLILDRVGRRKTIVYSLIGFGLVSLLSSFSVNFEMLYTTRLLAGIVLSGAINSTFPFFEELLPVKSRGKATVYLSAGWPFGTILAVGVAMLEPHLGGWRVLLVISSLASLWAFLIAKLPESPYWLASKGRDQEAKAAIAFLSEDQIHVHAETSLQISKVTKGSFLGIFQKNLLSVTLLATIVNFAFAFGYWGLYTWIPTLLQQKGLSMSESMGFVALSALCQIPGYVAASYLTSKYGRKKVMVTFVILASVVGFLFAYSTTIFQLYLFNFILGFFSLGAWGIWNTWLGEIYPTNMRGAGFNWGVGSQRWANALAPSLIGFVIGLGWAFGSTVSFIVLFMVVTFITVFFIKETEGKALD